MRYYYKTYSDNPKVSLETDTKLQLGSGTDYVPAGKAIRLDANKTPPRGFERVTRRALESAYGGRKRLESTLADTPFTIDPWGYAN